MECNGARRLPCPICRLRATICEGSLASGLVVLLRACVLGGGRVTLYPSDCRHASGQFSLMQLSALALTGCWRKPRRGANKPARQLDLDIPCCEVGNGTCRRNMGCASSSQWLRDWPSNGWVRDRELIFILGRRPSTTAAIQHAGSPYVSTCPSLRAGMIATGLLPYQKGYGHGTVVSPGTPRAYTTTPKQIEAVIVSRPWIGRIA